MRVIANGGHEVHAPPHECENGLPTVAYESPGRIASIRTALEKLGGFTFEEYSKPADEKLVRALHDLAYIAFLRETCRGLKKGTVAVPSVFPYGPTPPLHRGKAQAGIFCFDTYTAITPGTYSAALASVSAAAQGAELLADRKERIVYTMARPPGHHAERARCGGYSYFNNAAIAADRLAQDGPVAVLDVDVHHGNGTQHLFYDRSDVLVISLHGDPDHLFPHFSGFEEETGIGKGLGFNRNYPLPPGTGVRAYRPALETALEVIGRFRPAFLVVSLGTDTHEADPIGGFKLPTEFFRSMGERVRQLELPTLVVQEGGYNLETIGDCVAEFLAAIRSRVS